MILGLKIEKNVLLDSHWRYNSTLWTRKFFQIQNLQKKMITKRMYILGNELVIPKNASCENS